LYWASEKAQENASYAKDVAKQKSDELGITEKVSGTATYAYSQATEIGSTVATKAQENAAALQQSAQEGTLQQKAQDNAQYAAASIYGFGTSLYSQASHYYYGNDGSKYMIKEDSPNKEQEVVVEVSSETVNIGGEEEEATK